MCITVTVEDEHFTARFTNKLVHVVGYGNTRLEAVDNLMLEVPEYSLKEISQV